MSAHREDPPRWFEADSEAPAALRDWVAAARRDLPGDAELQAMGLYAGPSGAGDKPPGEVADSGGTLVTKAATLASAKGAAGVALVAALAGSAWWATRGSDEALTSSNSNNTTSALASNAATTVGRLSQPSVLGSDGIASSPVQATLQAPVVLQGPDEADLAPRAAGLRREKTSTASTELNLLQRAQLALKGAPAEALSLAERHRVQFPNGRLVQEREVIRIEALRGLGRGQQADNLAREFAQRFPGSAFLKRIAPRNARDQ